MGPDKQTDGGAFQDDVNFLFDPPAEEENEEPVEEEDDKE